MVELTDQQKAEYYQRSYTAVDGLWFIKAEDKHGFDDALDLDTEVWRVMPKIQARKLKAFTGLEQGLDALAECCSAKLRLDGFAFTEKARSFAPRCCKRGACGR